MHDSLLSKLPGSQTESSNFPITLIARKSSVSYLLFLKDSWSMEFNPFAAGIQVTSTRHSHSEQVYIDHIINRLSYAGIEPALNTHPHTHTLTRKSDKHPTSTHVYNISMHFILPYKRRRITWWRDTAWPCNRTWQALSALWRRRPNGPRWS